mgnify:CR=1 FL=1
MKKTLIFVSALTVALTGCAIKTHEVTSVPTNANVTIDIGYVKPANIKDALTNIHGYGRNTGKPKNIDKYTLSPKLYENTIANADFNAQVLNLDTYIHLRAIFHDDFIVKAYFYEDKLVGFLSALANNNHLDAHFIGLNYDLNRQHAIYPRILNDYVRIGIEKRVSHINFGRTASEIKTTIGATPVNLTCYIKHKRSFLNSIIKFIIKRVKLKEFKQHHPFKTKKEA